MKKIAVCLLMLSVMLTGMMNVYASESEMTVQIRASSTEVQVGDTVEYTVLATGREVVALQFEVRLPEGLRYVPNSGATPEGLAQKLGIPAADWTEQSMMFTCYNNVGITFADGTQILRFSCIAEKEGKWDVELFELLPFDGKFQEFDAELQVQTVHVTNGQGETMPTEPTVTGETVPPVTAPLAPETPSVTEPVDRVTQPASVPDQTVTQPEGETTPEPTHSLPEQTESDPEKATDPEEGTQPVQPEPKKNSMKWLLPVAGVVLAVCGVVVFHIFQKKRS